MPLQIKAFSEHIQTRDMQVQDGRKKLETSMQMLRDMRHQYDMARHDRNVCRKDLDQFKVSLLSHPGL